MPELQPCGTYAAYQRHYAHGEKPCESCRQARLDYLAAWRGRERGLTRADRIEDYLFIGGDRLPAWQAAERLGVTERTIWRWRKFLRDTGRQLAGAA